MTGETKEGTRVSASVRAREIAAVAVEAAREKLATDVVAIDVSSQLALSDVFVICTAGNGRQMQAVSDNIIERLAEFGERRLHREGNRDGVWVLLDYPDIVVHVQLEAARDFYRLERLWNDCPAISQPAYSGGDR